MVQLVDPHCSSSQTMRMFIQAAGDDDVVDPTEFINCLLSHETEMVLRDLQQAGIDK